MEPKRGSIRQTSQAPALLHLLCFSYPVGWNTKKCVCVCVCTRVEAYVKVSKYMPAQSYSLQ